MSDPLRVGVVGGGIGGLSAALSLLRAGLDGLDLGHDATRIAAA